MGNRRENVPRVPTGPFAGPWAAVNRRYGGVFLLQNRWSERLTDFVGGGASLVCMVEMSGVDARVEAQLEALGVARVAAQRAGAAARAFLEGSQEVRGWGRDSSGSVCVSVDAAGRVVEVRVDDVVDPRFVSAYEEAVADRGAKLADVAADAYGEESREARALVEQYGSARSREEERGPVVRGGVLRRGRRVGNTYGRGSL